MTPLLCSLAQWIVARRLDEGSPPPRWTLRHLDRCPACRAQHERHQRLIEDLAHTAARTRTEAPPFLRARILAHLDFSAPDVAPARRFSPLWGVAAAGVAAAIILLAWPRTPQVPATDPSVAVQNNFTPASAIFASLPSLDEPLESELQLVMADARAALSALSRNFLPPEPAPDRR